MWSDIAIPIMVTMYYLPVLFLAKFFMAQIGLAVVHTQIVYYTLCICRPMYEYKLTRIIVKQRQIQKVQYNEAVCFVILLSWQF